MGTVTTVATTSPALACLQDGPPLNVWTFSNMPGVYVVVAQSPADCAQGDVHLRASAHGAHHHDDHDRPRDHDHDARPPHHDHHLPPTTTTTSTEPDPSTDPGPPSGRAATGGRSSPMPWGG